MNSDGDKEEYKYRNITSLIIKSAFEVHNTLGCGFLEKVYERSLLNELNSNGLKAETQKACRIIYKGKEAGTYIADIIVEDKIIVELKTVDFLAMIHKAQALNYLKASGYEVALIFNFAKPRLEYRRVVR